MRRVVASTTRYAVTPVPLTCGPSGPWSIYVRWPHNCPCFIPPPTPKFARAPDGVPVIQPPPVTKSLPGQPGGGGDGGGGAGWQVISACAEDTITSAIPFTMMWSALTVMSPEPSLVCSLMITSPLGNGTVWLGCPETVMVWLFTERVATSALPLVVAPLPVHMAAARASRKSAAMVLPPTVNATCATEASDRLALPSPIVDACNTSAVSRPGTLASKSDACSDPPDEGSGPASTRTTGVRPSTLACTTVARPLKLVARVVEDAATSASRCGAAGSRSEQPSAN